MKNNMNKISDSRRQVSSRDSGWARKAAMWLSSNNVSPNFISVLSIGFSIITLISFYLDSVQCYNHILLMIVAIIGIQGRLIMNLLDGMVAIEHDKKSLVGGLYNEVPDRISDGLIIFGVGVLAQDYYLGLDLAYIAIILSVVTAYIRTLGASLGCKHYFVGPMAKQHRMAIITLACIFGIWLDTAFYYSLLVINFGLIITCVRRLMMISNELKSNPVKKI